MTSVPAPSRSDEDELIARAKRGDLEAFEGLYRQTAGRVYALCLRMAGDRERARELLQDVYVRVWERLDSFRGEAAFTSWLHRLTVNVVLADARAAQRRADRFGELPDETDAEGSRVAWDSGAAAMDRLDLESAIRKLPPATRHVFVLHEIEGYRHDEIASLTGKAPGTIRAQLHRARKLLMEALGR